VIARVAGVLALAIGFASTVSAQDDRALAIERRVLPTVTVPGRPVPSFSLEDRMKLYRVPGVSIAVVEGGLVAWARGYGVEELGTDRRVTAATPFQAASMSKPVAALAALRLVVAGRLGLDEDVNGRLQSWHLPAHQWSEQHPLTLRGLLSHTAGLTVHGFGGYAFGQPIPSIPEILDGRQPSNSPAVRVDIEPGSRWRYSGGGYTIAQLLLSEVAGKSFQDLARELVLDPMGMTESGYEQPLPLGRRSRAASGHDETGRIVEGRFRIYPEMAAAGLWTTPADLARFIIGVQRALAGAPNALLSKQMADTMLEERMGRWSLAFTIEGQRPHLRFSHAGANAGFRGQFVGYPEGRRGAVVMTNGDNGLGLVREILMTVAEAYRWSGYDRPAERAPVAVGAAELRRLAGDYRLPGDSTQRVTVSEGASGLTIRLPTGHSSALAPVSPTEFVIAELGALVRFGSERTSGRGVVTSPLFGRAVRLAGTGPREP